MKPDALQRRREAGLMLVTACEEALGVHGPTALARLTGRSKSWWSKLASGTAAFPTWDELAALLPSALPEEERDSLRHRHRRAWLGLYEPTLVERLESPVAPRLSLIELKVLLKSAARLGNRQGDHHTALRLERILEMLLVAHGIEALSREELSVLLHCLDHQSVCEGELGHHDVAIAAARRSVDYQKRGGSRVGELTARHALGLAQHNAGIHQQVGFLLKAVRQFEALQREYKRLGLTHELIRAHRDKGISQLYMGRQAEGEAELLQAYEVPQQSGEDLLSTARWLADASLRQGNVPQARRWLARLRVIRRRYPDDDARLMAYLFVSNHVKALERAAADPEPRRRR